MEKPAIYQLCYNTGLTGLSEHGTWIVRCQEETGRSNYPSWKNGGKKPTTVPRSTRTEPRDGTTRESDPKNSRKETRYYVLIPGSTYLGKENFEENGMVHTPSSMPLHMEQSQSRMTTVRFSR